MDLVVGTRNTHKLDELTRILSPLIPALVLHPAAGEAPVEDGETFRDNALIKARAAHQESSLPAIADDSGIEVTALGGAPGIHSARYAGTGDDGDNTALVLHNMAGLSNRGARFVCAAALVWSGGEIVIEQAWDGALAEAPTGAGGFGYDPIFIPQGQHCSAAELTRAQKDELSHRGKAFRALAAHIAKLESTTSKLE